MRFDMMRHVTHLIAFSICGSLCLAGGRIPTATIDRLLPNAKRRVERNPDDCRALLSYGKLCSFAFAVESNWLVAGASRDEDIPLYDRMLTIREQLAPRHDEPRLGYWGRPTKHWMPMRSTRLEYASEALASLTGALRCMPDSAAVHLATAFAFESTAHVAALIPHPSEDPGAPQEDLHVQFDHWFRMEQELIKAGNVSLSVPMDDVVGWFRKYARPLALLAVDPRPQVSECAIGTLQQLWRTLAVWHYRQSLDICSGMVASERIEKSSGQSYLIMSKEAHDLARRLLSSLTVSESTRSSLLERLEASYRVVAEKAGVETGQIVKSPVIFRPHAHNIEELADRGRTVCIDLDGDGVEESWEWVRPATRFLVYLSGASHVRIDGNGLLGEATWGICPASGYEALAMLDDDGSGDLVGPELRGLHVWEDSNGDGCNQVGEVSSVVGHKIVGIAYGPVIWHDHETLSVEAGIMFEDGTMCQTFDWMSKCYGR